MRKTWMTVLNRQVSSYYKRQGGDYSRSISRSFDRKLLCCWTGNDFRLLRTSQGVSGDSGVYRSSLKKKEVSGGERRARAAMISRISGRRPAEGITRQYGVTSRKMTGMFSNSGSRINGSSARKP